MFTKAVWLSHSCDGASESCAGRICLQENEVYSLKVDVFPLVFAHLFLGEQLLFRRQRINT